MPCPDLHCPHCRKGVCVLDAAFRVGCAERFICPGLAFLLGVSFSPPLCPSTFPEFLLLRDVACLAPKVSILRVTDSFRGTFFFPPGSQALGYLHQVYSWREMEDSVRDVDPHEGSSGLTHGWRGLSSRITSALTRGERTSPGDQGPSTTST